MEITRRNRKGFRGREQASIEMRFNCIVLSKSNHLKDFQKVTFSKVYISHRGGGDSVNALGTISSSKVAPRF